ncbi:MAG: Mrp/NBP35 family ATP-binding protein [Muribaculaceae bacterium]|jgi:ATP-binding protein involved in chromosome partitioning|nr:Mrp/NBP35 family ATP-binding protein [Muribaculaceae bacterium]MBR5787908.1 Mrp/NBP35 family ATP-binding protein [Muribaculaceae bacterium]
MTHDPIYPALITEALKTVRYPGNGKNLVENDMIEDDIRIDGRKVTFSLIFDKPTDPFMKSVVRAAETAILTYVGADVEIKGNIAVKTRRPVPEKPANPLPGVKNIIGVSSGKGGVGKSTVASNLAVALAAKGYKVGLLDADIFGPSVPKMFGLEDEQLYMEEVDGVNKIVPMEKYGVKLLSIGFVVDKNSAVLWRGGMASNALRQLITDANWGELDYFLIDMPPGTSDIHLTLVQTLPITGVVVVSTPQEVALADARKGIAMFTGDKVNVPILGLVENMAWFTPLQHPEEKYFIFGNGGGVRLAEEMGVDLLAQVPLVADICGNGDAGTPAALGLTADGQPAGPTPQVDAFWNLADNVVNAIDRRNDTLPPTSVVKMNS